MPSEEASALRDVARQIGQLAATIDAVARLNIAPLKSYTVAGLPTASLNTGGQVLCTDETGGATICFSDGTNWRRVQDRAVAS